MSVSGLSDNVVDWGVALSDWGALNGDTLGSNIGNVGSVRVLVVVLVVGLALVIDVLLLFPAVVEDLQDAEGAGKGHDE